MGTGSSPSRTASCPSTRNGNATDRGVDDGGHRRRRPGAAGRGPPRGPRPPPPPGGAAAPGGDALARRAGTGLAGLATTFSGEIGGPPTAAELAELLGWALSSVPDELLATAPPLPVHLTARRRAGGSAPASRFGGLN